MNNKRQQKRNEGMGRRENEGKRGVKEGRKVRTTEGKEEG